MKTMHKTALAVLGTFGIAGSTVAATMFADVPENFWGREAIEWAASNNIMTGPGGQERAFWPEKPVNRAELAAVSMRLYNKIDQGSIDALAQRITLLEERLNVRSSSSSSRSSRTSSSSSSSSSRSSETGTPNQPVSFIARLSGSMEVPAVISQGRGSATFRVTNDGLWYDITVTGLQSPITAAHFHYGRKGENGPAVESIMFVNGTARGYWEDITSTEWSALADNNIYVNVHTEDEPDGEIRGQVEFVR